MAAATINRKANTIEFLTTGDSLVVSSSDFFSINQIIWYGFGAATDNLVITINGENWIKYQAGATSGADRIPANTKLLKPGDTVVCTFGSGAIIMMLEETHG